MNILNNDDMERGELSFPFQMFNHHNTLTDDAVSVKADDRKKARTNCCQLIIMYDHPTKKERTFICFTLFLEFGYVLVKSPNDEKHLPYQNKLIYYFVIQT